MALVAASVPTVVPAIVAIARARGTTVTVAPPSRSHRQAEAIRRVAAALAARLSFGPDTPDLGLEADPGSVAAIESGPVAGTVPAAGVAAVTEPR